MNLVGIIGAGNISDVYLRTCKSFGNFKVKAIADLDMERARIRAEAHDLEAVTVAELLADETISVIVNLTVPAAHASVSRAALEAGKHVYSEKPLTTVRDDGRALLALANERGLRLGCAPDTFLGAGHQAARAAIDAGLIGEPIGATAFMMSGGPERWHPDPAFFYAPGAGPLFDMGPYYLTALINLFGPVARLSGSAITGRKERPILSEPRNGHLLNVATPTHVSAQLEFANGAAATLLTSFDSQASELPRCEVYGTEATLSLPDPNTFGGPLRLRRATSSEWELLTLDGPYTDNSRGLGLADMIDAVAHDGPAHDRPADVIPADARPHRASGELAFHVLDIMTSVLASAESHRWLELDSRCERPAPLPFDARF